MAAMSKTDEAATLQQEAIEELRARKAELAEAQEISRAAKNKLPNAPIDQLAECKREVEKAEDEVARLRWEVSKAKKEAARASGETADLNNLQKDIDVYRDAYHRRISGQQTIVLFLL
jgi:chromosome segregation ATPase